ncbi:uncharacterized protein [Antedon mediterranea]|uniref:uncharacterized protein n=1 Tax=Antedon mediterranea TaxID=105859 RepID=UPI003AF6CE83
MNAKLCALFFTVCLVYVVSAREANRCCFPKRYRIDYDLDTVFTMENGFLGYYPTNFSITFDFTKPRSLFTTGRFDVETGSTTYTNRIRHYSKKLEWIFSDSSPNCTLRELTAPDPLKCIPDTAELIQEYHMMENIEMADWEIQLNRSGIIGEQTLSVTKEGCLPVSEMFHLINFNVPQPAPFFQIGKYKNFQKISQSRTNKDFKLPKNCPKELASTLRKRSIDDDQEKEIDIEKEMEEFMMMQPLANW